MNERARRLWSKTRVRVWPEVYCLASLSPDAVREAAALVAESAGRFAALVLERDEVSLTVPDVVWAPSPLPARARAVAGPSRVPPVGPGLELDVGGYPAPAPDRL